MLEALDPRLRVAFYLPPDHAREVNPENLGGKPEMRLPARILALDGLSANEICIAAAQNVLAATSMDPATLDAFIYVLPGVPDALVSSGATRIQAAVGATNAMSFSVGDLGCSSVAAALVVADTLVRGRFKNVLVAGVSKAPRHLRFRPPGTVLGDGGFAALVSRAGPGWRVLDVRLQTDGAFSDTFSIDYQRSAATEWRLEQNTGDLSFRLPHATVKRLNALLREALAERSIDRRDVKYVVGQNLSYDSGAFFEEAVGVEVLPGSAEIYDQFGHLGVVDTMLNLDTGVRRGLVQPGDVVLLVTSSPSAAWGAALIRI